MTSTGTNNAITAENAYKLPPPKGFACAASCGHSIATHREAGCDVRECECPAPYGRILPSVEATTPTLCIKFTGGWCDGCEIAAKTKQCPACAGSMHPAQVEIVQDA